MNQKEREENPGESFDGGYHLYAKEKHKERVAKNPDRIAYAIEQFKANGIRYELKDRRICHFHCWRKADGKRFDFYAGTGKIKGYNQRGIHNMIKILNGKPKKSRYNFAMQYYKGIPIRLIDRDYRGYKAKRFTLNETNQNVWIPNKHLDEDGTLKPDENIDYVFRQARIQLQYAGITGAISGIQADMSKKAE